MRNLKVRFLSGALALMLGVVPGLSKAENSSSDSQSSDKTYTVSRNVYSILPVSQESKAKAMSVSDYLKGVLEVKEKLNKFIDKQSNYDDDMQKAFMQEIECLYFLSNRDYISSDVEKKLINGVSATIDGKSVLIKPIFETDMSRMADMSGMQNFMYATMFLNFVSDYNDSMVGHTDNIDDLIDLSIFCANENDRKIVHEIFVHWAKSHMGTKESLTSCKSTYNMAEFEEAFKILTTLNANENKYNAANLSVGARWMAQCGHGFDLMQVARDWFFDNYTMKELSRYFVSEELVKGQLFLRSDVLPEYNFLGEWQCAEDMNNVEPSLEEMVFMFGQLWTFCIDDVNNDIFKSFEGHCKVLELK